MSLKDQEDILNLITRLTSELTHENAWARERQIARIWDYLCSVGVSRIQADQEFANRYIEGRATVTELADYLVQREKESKGPGLHFP